MKYKRIVFIIFIILILLITSVGITFAATSSELQEKQKEIDNQIKELNSEIAGNKAQMTNALTQINKLNSEISNYEDEISDLETRIINVTAQIAEKEANIKEQEIKYENQKELLSKRLVALYESGSMSYLDLLLSADSLSDFISKYYMIEQLAEYDEDLLNQIENTKKQIEAEKEYLISAKAEIENSKIAIEGKKNSLASSKNQKEALVTTLSEEEKTLQEQLEEFERDKKEVQRQLAALASKYKGVAVAPSAAGYTSPLPGRTKSNITTGYGAYAGHTGVDFACPGGTPILAVKSGKVVTSTSLRYSNGHYKSYGEYIVIDHGDGTMTLYAHMQPGSRLVSAGASVSQGQQIGSVGTTGNSTGNHLHFEVWSNGRRTNPVPYLP